MVTGVTETFRNVTVADSPRRVDKVLLSLSSLVTVSGALPTAIPPANAPTPPPGKTVWDDNSTSTPSDGAGDDGSGLGEEDFASDQLQQAKQGLYALLVQILQYLMHPTLHATDDVEYSALSPKCSNVVRRQASDASGRSAEQLDKC